MEKKCNKRAEWKESVSAGLMFLIVLSSLPAAVGAAAPTPLEELAALEGRVVVLGEELRAVERGGAGGGSRDRLLYELAAIREKILAIESGAQTPLLSSCYTFGKNLRVGDSGPAVENLAKVLYKEGFLDREEGSWNFDERIASAVSRFQEKYSADILIPNGFSRGNGFVGALTRAKLNALYACSSAERLPHITILSPNGGEKFLLGQAVSLRWDSQNASRINIALIDGAGKETVKNLVNVRGNPGSASWIIPKTLVPGQYFIRASVCVESAAVSCPSVNENNMLATDRSDSSFVIARDDPKKVTDITPVTGARSKTSTVQNVSPYVSIPSLAVTSPTAGAVWRGGDAYRISWTAQGIAQFGITLNRWPDGAATAVISNPTLRENSYVWTVPSSIPSGNYYVLVYGNPRSAGTDAKSGRITILTAALPQVVIRPSISFLSPSRGPAGTKITITGSNFSASADNLISFMVNNGGNGVSFIASSPDGKSLSFTAPDYSAGVYQVTVQRLDQGAASSNSANFTLTAPPPAVSFSLPPSSTSSITVTAPAEGRTFEGKAGTSIPVRWTTKNWPVTEDYVFVNVDLVNPDNSLIRVGNIQPNSGLFRLNINANQTTSKTYRVRVSAAKLGTLAPGEEAYSGFFTITPYVPPASPATNQNSE